MQPEPVHSGSCFTNYSDIAGVVAIESAGPFMRLFIRSGAGILHEDIPYHPFLLAMQPVDPATLPVPCDCLPLHGPGVYGYLLVCQNWHDCCLLQSHLALADKNHPTLFIPDACQQFLLTSGITFFRGLSGDALPVTLLATETVRSAEGTIFRIVLADRLHGEVVLSSAEMPENMMFERLSMLIREQDPDLLVGFELLKQLPELIRRARNAGAHLPWGRDGSAPRLYEPKTAASGQSEHDTRCHVFGRSIIDLQCLIQRLHQAQPTGNYAEPLRTVLHPDATSAASDALQRLRTDSEIYRLLLPSLLQLAGIAPFPPQSSIRRDGPALLGSLMLGAYLQQGHALPALQKGTAPDREHRSQRPLRQGLYGPVAHCEIRALFPSVLLAYRLAPRNDRLGVFLKLLQRLSSLKKEARVEAETAVSAEQFTAADSRRAMLADLAGACHGLLGSTRFAFADHQTAAEAERLVRVLTNDLLNWLREQGAEPLELDRDGIYFIPPSDHDGTAEVAGLMERLNGILPGEMTISCDVGYRAMLCYKPGNFALLGHDGRLYLHGSSMKAGNLEPFLRGFLHRALRLLLEGAADRVPYLYEELLQQLAARRIPVEQLARTETIPVSPEQYRRELQAGKRHHNAASELALKSGVKLHAGERISYYVTGNGKNIAVHQHCRLVSQFDPSHPDINTSWYAEKLHHLYQRLSPFISDRPGLFCIDSP